MEKRINFEGDVLDLVIVEEETSNFTTSLKRRDVVVVGMATYTT